MATIVVRHERPPIRRDRVNLTAVAHQRLMILLLLLIAISSVLVLRLTWMGVFSGGRDNQAGAMGGIPSVPT